MTEHTQILKQTDGTSMCKCGNVPGSASVIDTWTMAASTAVYTGTCTSMTNIVTRNAKIYSTSHTMTAATGYTLTYDSGFAKYLALYNNPGTIKWRVSGSLSAITYKAICSGNATLHCHGFVEV